MMQATGLGLITPEETLKRANSLNNDFQLLWRDTMPHPKLRKELDAVMAGWVKYYDRLRNSWVARFSEWGELSGWEKIYQKFRDRVQAAGIKVKAPAVTPGKVPGDFKVKPDAEGMKEAEDRAKKVGIALIGGGAAAALGVGYLLWRLRRR